MDEDNANQEAGHGTKLGELYRKIRSKQVPFGSIRETHRSYPSYHQMNGSVAFTFNGMFYRSIVLTSYGHPGVSMPAVDLFHDADEAKVILTYALYNQHIEQSRTLARTATARFWS